MSLWFSGPENVDLIFPYDEEDNLDVASMSLILSGYNEEKFQRVTCGEDNIEKVKEMQTGEAEVPRVVLLDLNMPP
jgi:CheY-like chemotaxis protein